MMYDALVVRSTVPFNAEMSLPAQVGIITPNARFYVRNHYDVPRIDPSAWYLSVGGLVRHRLGFSLADLHRLPSRSVIVTLECAGNGRALLDPPVAGEQWQLGAVSTAEWTGVSLVEVLDRAGVESATREIVFRGGDHGSTHGAAGSVAFERSLPVEVTRDPDVVLAYAMNGELLPPNHGFPLRLVVPGWYGMASVKWLTHIDAINRPFTGYFQTDRYVIESDDQGRAGKEPLTQTRVRAIITQPETGDVIRQGELLIRGLAWSGRGHITHVDVDAGHGWHTAQLLDEPLPHAWRRWELTTRVAAGRVTLRARASDASGGTQPETAGRNRLGYANNAIHGVPIEVFA